MMRRVRRSLSRDEVERLREQLTSLVPQAHARLPELIRHMRLIARMSQAEYSRLCKVAPRVLAEIEAGRGNPRVETLEKLLKPFGYEVGVVAPKPVEPIRRIARQVVTRAELNRILTQELRKVGGFEDATLRMMYVFPTPDETGANWSADVVFNAGSGSGLGSRAVVDKIVKTARERYSVRD